MLRIAYFGPEGTFTEQATRAFIATHGLDPAALIPASTVPGALAALRSGEVEAACVPMENSVEGSVPATLDALSEGDPLTIVAETVLPVRFSVLVRPGTPKADIRTVGTHPHAAAQVSGWLAEHLPDATVVPTSSTAAGAVAVQRGDVDAAISNPVAVEHYPLAVLATDIADVRDAVTRFLLIRRPGESPEPSGADRSSLMFVVADQVGALAEVLTEFSLRGINMSRIESRPIRQQFGEYRFFLDIEGHIAEARLGDVLMALRRRCILVRFLGSYRRADGVAAGVLPSASDERFTEAADWLRAVRAGSGG
jgi:prephenate dehydratase